MEKHYVDWKKRQTRKCAEMKYGEKEEKTWRFENLFADNCLKERLRFIN